MIRNLLEIVRDRAERVPDRIALTVLNQGERGETELTYGGLELRARSAAGWLQERCRPGDRVLIASSDQGAFLTAFFGCVFAGVIAVPVAPPRSGQAFARLLAVARAAGARLALASGDLRGLLQQRMAAADGAPGLDWHFVDELPDGAEAGWRPPALGRDPVALLQFTSGSTGNPKGVIVSHANVLHNCALLESVCGSSPDFTLVSWLPNFHDWGLIGCLIFPLAIGRPAVSFDPADFLYRPLRWLEAISRFRGTVSCAPNFAYEMCLAAAEEAVRAGLDLGAWEMAMVGAEPVRTATIDRFSAAYAPCGFRREAFFPTYGLAESTLIVSGGTRPAPPIVLHVARAELDQGHAVAAAPDDPGVRALVGCGRPLLDQIVAIVDPQRGTHCAPDEVGEIWVSGPSVARGYWGDGELSEEVFSGRLAAEADRTYLRTGDLGFLHDGELFVCGRLKDLIIKAGVNHFAEDIEHTVGQSHPALRPNACAVFGIEAAGMERLVVVQEIQPGARSQAESIIGTIQAAVAREHAVLADAISILRPGGLEKTGSGKIRRHRARALFLAGELPLVSDWRCW
jgi:acyl-CoA synthetase (AMP-forming)/AMP-acid ligase II